MSTNSSEAVTKIAELAREGADLREVGGHAFAAVPMHQVTPKAPEPQAMTVHTLQGLADYLDVNQDALEAAEVSIHIVGPTEVRVVSSLQPETAQRFTYLRATYEPRVGSGHGTEFSFGSFVAVEDANIALQSLFADAGGREAALKLIGNVKDKGVKTQADDGVTQTVTARTELALDEVEVPNPVDLAPFRTFPEVDQPLSPFILRMRSSERQGVMAALFEADGGAWKLDAIEEIRGWLSENAPPEFPVLS